MKQLLTTAFKVMVFFTVAAIVVLEAGLVIIHESRNNTDDSNIVDYFEPHESCAQEIDDITMSSELKQHDVIMMTCSNTTTTSTPSTTTTTFPPPPPPLEPPAKCDTTFECYGD